MRLQVINGLTILAGITISSENCRSPLDITRAAIVLRTRIVLEDMPDKPQQVTPLSLEFFFLCAITIPLLVGFAFVGLR